MNDMAQRAIPFFQQSIMPQVAQGMNVLLSANMVSVGALTMFIEQRAMKEAWAASIPTGEPHIYSYEGGRLNPISWCKKKDNAGNR